MNKENKEEHEFEWEQDRIEELKQEGDNELL